MYVGGMSSSLPEDVQHDMYHSVPGLEHAKIVKMHTQSSMIASIQDSCIRHWSLKQLKELFSGGQFNGSSGYEEAASQGLVAGINAALEVLGREQIVIDRSQGYIGVLIDDLVTKDNHEPYRMMTSRSEYRLLLRQDNADQRLTPVGYQVGLISKERYQKLQTKVRPIDEENSVWKRPW